MLEQQAIVIQAPIDGEAAGDRWLAQAAPLVRIRSPSAASLRTIGSAAARMAVVGDFDAGDGRAVPKPILQETLMECTISREAADTLNFRFNVSYLTRMRPPVKYHQKHGRTSWRYGCNTFRSVRNDPVMLSLYCSCPGKEAPTLCKSGFPNRLMFSDGACDDQLAGNATSS